MIKIFKSISYIFHPVIMPLLGVIFYFSKTPRAVPKEIIWAKLISISILTVALPILLFFLLKTLKNAKSIFLRTPKERLVPLLLNSFIIFLILTRVLTAYEYIELHGFFIGILISNLTCLILAILKFKASIHMMALGGIFTFFIALGIYFNKNIIGTAALLCIIIGAVATSRLILRAHTNKELLVGLFIGIIPQMIAFKIWL